MAFMQWLCALPTLATRALGRVQRTEGTEKKERSDPVYLLSA